MAKVIQVSASEKKAVVVVVPRIDTTTKEALLDHVESKWNEKLDVYQDKNIWVNPTNKINPTQIFFDRDAIRNHVESVNRTEAGKQLKLINPEMRVYEHMVGNPRLIYWRRGFYTNTGWRCIHYPLSALVSKSKATQEQCSCNYHCALY